MSSPRHLALSIDDLDRAAASRDPEDRTRALQALLIRIRRDHATRPGALPIFRRVVLLEREPWPAVLAARGIEEIEGAAAARPVWMKLLEREAPGVVASAAAAVEGPWYLPAFLDLLHRRPEPAVRAAAIRGLGRIRDASVFPAIIGFLDDPALRAHVIEALADQGDERARPHLMALVDDQTETGEWDDRGAPIRIGALAWSAIRRFDEPDFAQHFDRANLLAFHDAGWGDPVPPMLGGPPPFRGETAPEPPPAPATPPRAPAPIPSPTPSPTPPRLQATARVPGATPVRFPATFMGFQIVALVPLAVAVFQAFWTVFLLAMLAEAFRLNEPSPLRGPALNVLGMIPGSLGVAAALVIPFVVRLKALELAAVIAGAVACLPLVVMFGQDLLR